MRDVRDDLLAFGQLLRGAGVMVRTADIVMFTEAAAWLTPAQLDDLYWLGRAALTTGPEDFAVYDRMFRAFFLQHDEHTEVSDEAPLERQEVPGGSDPSRPDGVAHASERERLRYRRFDLASPEEQRLIVAAMARLRVAVPLRRSRRHTAAPRGRPELRRTLRAALRTDGELLSLARRGPSRRPRPLVLLLDVSGSMAGFSRAMLHFAFTAQVATESLEVFCFATRLTRITREVHRRTVDAAVQAAAERVVDWDGGTRIGESIAAFHRQWTHRGIGRGAVVVICSDGLERGDAELLAGEMSRLSRLAHAVVWVNPLVGGENFRPTQRGMRAALPHVDRLSGGRDLASLEHLMIVLAAETQV